jgi:hypothetical protein
MRSTLSSVDDEGVMRLSVTNYLLLHHILKKLFSELKNKKEQNIKISIKNFQNNLSVLGLTRNEILLFSAKILIVLAVSGMKREMKNGN